MVCPVLKRVRVSPGFIFGYGRNGMCLIGFLLGDSNAEKQGDHRKKNFFINNSLGLSMCDGPIETVK